MKKFIKVDNHKVEVNVFGKAKNSLILLAGWTHDFQYETNFINELSKEWKVVIISYPGYSGSDENDKAKSVKYLSKLINPVASNLDIERFKLVGFSMGCQVVLNYIRDNPKQTAILISPIMHPLLEDAPWYGKIILKSSTLISIIRRSKFLKSFLVNMASSQISTVTVGVERKSNFSDTRISTTGAFDTLIATVGSFINPLLYKNQVRFIFGENEVSRKVLDTNNIKYDVLKNSGHGVFDTNYKTIANLISENTPI